MPTSDSRTRPIGPGAAVGVAAFVLGYLVTYLWQGSRVRESLEGINAILQFFGGTQIPAWKAVGWLFFNAHFVRTQIPGMGGPQTRNFIASGDVTALLYAVPVILLLAAGFLVVWMGDAADVQGGAIDGALVTVGYVVAVIVAVFVFAASRGDASITPDPVTGILLAGIVYPLVLGAIGGVLASMVSSDDRGTRERIVD